MATPEEVEPKIIAAVECAISKGYTLYRNLSRDDSAKECCAIAAVAVCDDYTPKVFTDPGNLGYGARKLGLTDQELGYFIDGFDDVDWAIKDEPFTKLGAKLRRKLKARKHR